MLHGWRAAKSPRVRVGRGGGCGSFAASRCGGRCGAPASARMTSHERAGAREDAARSADLLDAAEDDDGARRPSERLGLAAELVVDCECAPRCARRGIRKPRRRDRRLRDPAARGRRGRCRQRRGRRHCPPRGPSLSGQPRGRRPRRRGRRD